MLISEIKARLALSEEDRLAAQKAESQARKRYTETPDGKHVYEQVPSGSFDDHGRWFPNEMERAKCCDAIRMPTNYHKYSLLEHCRTLVHIQCRDMEWASDLSGMLLGDRMTLEQLRVAYEDSTNMSRRAKNTKGFKSVEVSWSSFLNLFFVNVRFWDKSGQDLTGQVDQAALFILIRDMGLEPDNWEWSTK